MKEFFCDCVNPDYEELGLKDTNEFSDFISNAKEINKTEFLENCNISNMDLFKEPLKESIKKYPHSFSFYKNKDIYFFENSAIEHFFK